MRVQASRRTAIRLSVGPAFARGWLVGKLGHFYRNYPDIDLEIIAVKLNEADKQSVLKAGEADIAIRYGSPHDWPRLQCLKLLQCSAFPVCSPAYITAAGPFKKPADLAHVTLLRLSGQSWTPWFKAAGVAVEEPSKGPLFSDASIMLDAAASGQGVALARSVLVNFETRVGRLVRLFNIGIPSDSAYHAICSSKSLRRPEVRKFLDWITRIAEDESTT